MGIIGELRKIAISGDMIDRAVVSRLGDLKRAELSAKRYDSKSTNSDYIKSKNFRQFRNLKKLVPPGKSDVLDFTLRRDGKFFWSNSGMYPYDPANGIGTPYREYDNLMHHTVNDGKLGGNKNGRIKGVYDSPLGREDEFDRIKKIEAHYGVPPKKDMKKWLHPSEADDSYIEIRKNLSGMKITDPDYLKNLEHNIHVDHANNMKAVDEIVDRVRKTNNAVMDSIKESRPTSAHNGRWKIPVAVGSMVIGTGVGGYLAYRAHKNKNKQK